MIRKHRHLISIFAFSAFLSAGLVLGASTARADGEGEDKCTTKKFKNKKVEAACAKDGRAGAKTLMKKVVKDQKAAGNDINCKSCHNSLKTYDLKDNAAADLAKYLK